MMANKRYKAVEKNLHEAFLAEKQQCPHDVLAMKRFMADFIGADAGKPKWQQQQQPKPDVPNKARVIFLSPDQIPWPMCHICGKQHESGYLKCCPITEDHHERIRKLVKAGAFDDKSGGSGGNTTAARTIGGNKPTKQKRGTVNAVVKEKTTKKEQRSKKMECPPESSFFRCLAGLTLWLAMPIISKIQHPSLQDVVMVMPYLI